MSFPAGTRLIVVTKAEPDHVVSRFVCHSIDQERYVTLDTSGSLVVEDYDDDSMYQVVRVLPDDGTLPFGISGNLEDWDDFVAWPTESEGKALFTEARRHAVVDAVLRQAGLRESLLEGLYGRLHGELLVGHRLGRNDGAIFDDHHSGGNGT